MPVCETRGAIHIRLDGAQKDGDRFRPKFADPAGERRLGRETGCAADLRREPVHRRGAGIDEIAPGRSEEGQEILVAQGRDDGAKGVPYGAVEAGIAPIEESAGGGRSLAYEEQAYGVRAVMAAEFFALAHCGGSGFDTFMIHQWQCYSGFTDFQAAI